MRLGLMFGYSGAKMEVPIHLIHQAEEMGFDSVWFSESWGSDAVTPAAWVLGQTKRIKAGTAIMQMPGRTPACTAMTAMTLQQLSNNRFLLGLGASGPQVVEGWHGLPYGRPITRTKEYIQIIRKILQRDEPLVYEGREYRIPYDGEKATGLGKPLKSILHGDPSLKIYTAAITHNGVRCAAEFADGFFPVWMNPDRYDVFETALTQGFERAGGRRPGFDIAPFVDVVLGDDLEKCRRPIKAGLALYIGGMGAKGKNFYTDYATKLGYEDEANAIQDLYLSGKKMEATAAVPDQLVDDCALVGSAAHIQEQMQRWLAAEKREHVTSMLLRVNSPEAAAAVMKAAAN